MRVRRAKPLSGVLLTACIPLALCLGCKTLVKRGGRPRRNEHNPLYTDFERAGFAEVYPRLNYAVGAA